MRSTDITISSPSISSRRALLAGVLGGIGAWMASVVAGMPPARAANGDPVTVGGDLEGTTPTRITNTAGATAFRGTVTVPGGSGIHGRATATADNSEGVRGSCDSDSGSGVLGLGPIGVSGASVREHGTGMSAVAVGSGVTFGLDAEAMSASGTAVRGVNWATSGGARAVYGEVHSPSGVAVMGDAIATSGLSRGVLGLARSTGGRGVSGAGLASSGATIGVEGRVSSTGGTGVLGFSGTGSPPDPKPRTGVYGHATQGSGGRGVWGRSDAGQGVRGQATSGTGLYGMASGGYALRTFGRVRIGKVSGVATIAAGNTSVTVSPGVNVHSGSFVLLTPKADIGSRGLWFTTNTSADSFTIRISSARGASTQVAWLLLG